MWPIIIACVVVAGILAGWWWMRRRNAAPKSRLISFVALLREPQSLEPIYIATAANKAWDADLGDGTTEGDDGFVVGGAEITSMVKFRERMLIVNNFPSPYVDDPEEAAQSIIDLRLRRLFAEHTAWLSCDALGVESTDSEDTIRDWYRTVGSLLSELIDDNCLAIYLPDSDQIYAYSPETLEMLRSDDPFAALFENAEVPVVAIAEDSPAMLKAVEVARQRWPEFVAAFEERAGTNYAVKAPITRKGNTEFIWVQVTAIENDVIFGELGNEPANLPGLRLGSRVRTSVEDVNDWGYLSATEEFIGGFTVKAVMEAARKQQKKS